MGDDEAEQVYTVQYVDELGMTEAPMVGDAAWISRAGRAKVVYVNQDVYEGGYNEGKQRHGQGVYTWNSLTPAADEEEDGEAPTLPTPQYSGQYQYGKKHGLGTMIYPNGDKYRGQFAYNKRHGRGTYEYFATKNKYSGEWKEDKRHGSGVFVYAATESQLVGTFKNGQMVKGKWLLADGTVFVGNFSNSTPTGNGSFTLPSGNTITGRYVPPTEEEIEDAEDGEAAPQWQTTSEPAIAQTSHAELSRPPMPALEYNPAWDTPLGNKNLRIIEVNEEGGYAVIQHVKPEPVEGEDAEPEAEDDEDAEPKDTSANLKGMRLSVSSVADDGGLSFVFGDVSLAVGGKLRLLSAAAAQAPPKKQPKADGEDDEPEDDEDGPETKEYFVSNENMFAGGLSSIKLDFMDKLGAPQLVWEVTKTESEEAPGTFTLEHEGTYKPIPPPEPVADEEQENEDDDD